MAVIDKNKLLGKKEKEGGALAVIPKSPLVVSSGEELSKIPEKPQEDVVYTIRTRVIEIDKLLKGTLAEEKVQQKKERKQKEVEQRSQKEDKLEKPDKDVKKESPKQLLPKLSFLDGIKKFLGGVLMGWLTLRLIKFLPKIVSFLKPAAAFVDWVLKWGGKLLDGLITFVDWGYKAVEGTKEWIGDKFGEDAEKKFASFMSNLNGVMNLVIALGLAAAKMSRRNRGGGPNKPKGPKSKLRKALERGWKKTRLGKILRNNAAVRKKLIRRIQRSAVGRAVDAIRPKNILKTVSESKIVKNLSQRTTDVLEKAKNVDLGKTVKSLSETQVGKTATELVEKVKNVDVGKVVQKGKDLIIEGGGKALSSASKNISAFFKPFGEGASWLLKKSGEGLSWLGKKGLEGFSNTRQFLQELPANLKKQYDDIAAKVGPIVTEKLGAAKSKFDEIGAGIGKQLDKLDPKKVMLQIQDAVKKNLDDILQKNPIIKKIATNLNPKNAIEFVAKNFDNVGKKMLPIADVVRKNKGMMDGLGPADIAIDAIFAILDYAAFGESPINAIVKAMAGTLGFAAGSAIGTAATAGVPSPLSFIGGIFGAAAGEWLASKMLSGVIKAFPGLAEIQDPIAEKLGLAPRSIIRDPSGLLDHMIKQDDGSVVMKDEFKENWNESQGDADNIVSTDGVSQKVDGVSTEASYEEGSGETIVVKSGSETETDVSTDTKTEESLTPVIIGGGGGDSEVGDLLYKGG